MKKRYSGPHNDEAYLRHCYDVSVWNECGCLIWPYGTNPQGYGFVHPPSRSSGVLLSRFAWSIENKVSLTTQEYLLHSCDTPRCWNLNHLRVGTQKDNMRDMSKRGHHSVGSRAKLTNEDVFEIRKRFTGTYRGEIARLAKDYGVKSSWISQIVRGKVRL